MEELSRKWELLVDCKGVLGVYRKCDDCIGIYRHIYPKP